MYATRPGHGYRDTRCVSVAVALVPDRMQTKRCGLTARLKWFPGSLAVQGAGTEENLGKTRGCNFQGVMLLDPLPAGLPHGAS